MLDYSKKIEKLYRTHSNKEIAIHMAKYLKNKFECFGLKSPERKELSKQFIKEYGYPDYNNLEQVTKDLWALPQRELHYFAIEMLDRFVKKSEKEFINLLEFMIVNNSWWDSVDTIAVRLVGEYFKKYPELTREYTDRWINSDNMWLQRTAILFQLKYKKDTNLYLLFEYIKKCSHSKEFFIRKAIGWT